MGNGKSIIDQIQDALRDMDETGFLKDLTERPKVDDAQKDDPALAPGKPDVPRDPYASPS